MKFLHFHVEGKGILVSAGQFEVTSHQLARCCKAQGLASSKRLGPQNTFHAGLGYAVVISHSVIVKEQDCSLASCWALFCWDNLVMWHNIDCFTGMCQVQAILNHRESETTQCWQTTG
jgi:hypothetical protein